MIFGRAPEASRTGKLRHARRVWLFRAERVFPVSAAE